MTSPIHSGRLDAAQQQELAEAAAAQPLGLLEQALRQAPGAASRPAPTPALVERLLAARAPRETLVALLGADYRWSAGVDFATLRRQLDVAVAGIDRLLSGQVNRILHHEKFQRLEASWRGLFYLHDQVQSARLAAEDLGEDVDIRIRVLNVSKRELRRDLDAALEFDQSALFKKVYEAEFGTAGGEPFGLLVGDYEFSHHPDDVQTLERIAQVAAAAFAPFIASAAPRLLGLDDFRDLQLPLDFQAVFQQADYIPWRSLREFEDARFVGLTLPHVLLRPPYALEDSRQAGFRFVEDAAGPDASKYLWGNSAYALAAVISRAFAQSKWFAEIRGAERNVEGGGLVTGLAVDQFHTDAPGVAPKISTQVAIDDLREKELSSLGFIPLCHCHGTPLCVFYSNQSLHKPRKFDDDAATANARISSMLQYMLCTARFAHYLKVLARNWLGSAPSTQQVQSKLSNWVHRYVTPDERASPSTKARFPLREAEVVVEEVLAQPGSYRLIMRLLPHYQLDDLTAALRLVTRVDSSLSG